jgi:predicted amidophosphoribosyltransferase
MPSEQSGIFCDTCLQQLSVRDAFPLTRTAQVRTYAAMLFNAQNRTLLYGHKFRQKERYTDLLTRLLVSYWEQILASAPLDLAQDMVWVEKGNAQAITVVPIPPHGEESSHLAPIAEAFAKHFGYAYEPELLQWGRTVQPQHKLSGKKRRFANVQGSLNVVYQDNPKRLLTTRRILVIDDIHTTGATLHEASQAFLRCPVFDGVVTNLALSYLSLAFQKHHRYQEMLIDDEALDFAMDERLLAAAAKASPMPRPDNVVEISAAS